MMAQREAAETLWIGLIGTNTEVCAVVNNKREPRRGRKKKKKKRGIGDDLRFRLGIVFCI